MRSCLAKLQIGEILNYFTLEINFNLNREDIGTWTSGTPGTMKFKAGMEEKIVQFRAKTVYRVVTVVQPPFMLWNETTSKYKVDVVREEDVEYYLKWKRLTMTM